MERWAGKVAVVTGASSGIGAAIAAELVKHGLQVVGLARRVETIQKAAVPLSDYPGKLHAIKADMTIEDDIIAAFEWTVKNLGGVHIIINNAGLSCNSSLAAGETADWRRVLETNVLGLSIATREAVQVMKKNGVEGHVININSVAGHTIPPGFGQILHMYGASKHAVTALTQTLARELTDLKKIRVTSVSPGMVRTEFVEAAKLNMDSSVLDDMPALSSIDVANAILYILSAPPHVQISELTIQPLGETY